MEGLNYGLRRPMSAVARKSLNERVMNLPRAVTPEMAGPSRL
jgi:hypothetical protein